MVSVAANGDTHSEAHMARYRKDPRDQHLPREEPYPTSRPRAFDRIVAVETAEAVADHADRAIVAHLGPVHVRRVKGSQQSLPNGTQLCRVTVRTADGHAVG